MSDPLFDQIKRTILDMSDFYLGRTSYLDAGGTRRVDRVGPHIVVIFDLSKMQMDSFQRIKGALETFTQHLRNAGVAEVELTQHSLDVPASQNKQGNLRQTLSNALRPQLKDEREEALSGTTFSLTLPADQDTATKLASAYQAVVEEQGARILSSSVLYAKNLTARLGPNREKAFENILKKNGLMSIPEP